MANQMPLATMQDVLAMGKLFAQSGLFGCKKDEQGAMMALTCYTEGISPLAFKRQYHLSEDGQLMMRADYMLGAFRQGGGRYRVVEYGPTRAAAEFTVDSNTTAFEITMAEAVASGWPINGKGETKKVWKANPAALLWARMTSRAVRALMPEVVAGLYVPEELDDNDKAIDIVAEPGETVAPTTVAAQLPPAEPQRVSPRTAAVAMSEPFPAAKVESAPKAEAPAAQPTAAAPAAAPAPAPAATKAAPTVDYSVLPAAVGKTLEGKTWKDCTDKHLLYFCDFPARFTWLTGDYRAVMLVEMASRPTLAERAKAEQAKK